MLTLGFKFLNDTFKLTDIGVKACSYVFDNVIRQVHFKEFSLAFDDSDACFKIRGLYICDKSRFKTAFKSVFKSFYFFWWAVGSQDYLAFCFIEGVESVEKFFLSRFFSAYELDVVYQEDIRFSVFVSEVTCGVEADSLDKFVGEVIALYIDDSFFGISSVDLVSDGVEKVSFAKTGVCGYEKGSVRAAGSLNVNS